MNSVVLYIREATSGDRCLFYIFDAKEELLWKVYALDGAPGKMHMTDMEGQPLLTIQPASLSLHPKYHLSIAGLERVRVVYKSGLSANPTLTGIGWVILGEVCTGNYSVQDRNEQNIFNHEKKWSPGGEYIELEVPLSEHLLLAAGIAVTINQTLVVMPQIQPI